jgi:hypothetical protein
MIIIITPIIKSCFYVEEIYNGKTRAYILCNNKTEALDIIIEGIKAIYYFTIESYNDEEFYKRNIIQDGYYWNSLYYQETFNEDCIWELKMGIRGLK